MAAGVGRPCPVCARKSHASLDRDLSRGTFTVSAAAAAYGIPEPDLRRHIEGCAVPVWDEDSASGPQDSPAAVMRSIMVSSRLLQDVAEQPSQKPGTVVRAVAELTRLLELRAKVAGLMQPELAAAGAGAALGTEIMVNLVEVVQTVLVEHPEAQARLLAALEGVETPAPRAVGAAGVGEPEPVPANVAPEASPFVRQSWANGGDGG